MNTINTNPEAEKQNAPPLLLQTLYDGELTNDEADELYKNIDDNDTKRLHALKEISQLTKFDSENALETINPQKILQNIEKRISKNQKKDTVLIFKKHLPVIIPSLIAAGALLALIPSLILLSNKNTPVEKEKTIVIMDASGSFVNPGAVSYTASQAPVIWYDGSTEAAIDKKIEQINNRLEDLEKIQNPNNDNPQQIFGEPKINTDKI